MKVKKIPTRMAAISIVVKVRLAADDEGDALIEAVRRGCWSMVNAIIDYANTIISTNDDGEDLQISTSDIDFAEIEETEVEDESE